jgi:Rap1a immunity proteins
MKRGVLQLAAVGFVLASASGAKAAPATEDNFLLKTTADLVALCAADQKDPLYTAAVNYCHGFAVGTYRMLEVEDAASRKKHKDLCLQQYAMTRSQAMAGFLTWVADKPKVLEMAPTDGFSEYLMQTFACKK